MNEISFPYFIKKKMGIPLKYANNTILNGLEETIEKTKQAISKNESVILLGPCGTGKTTLMTRLGLIWWVINNIPEEEQESFYQEKLPMDSPMLNAKFDKLPVFVSVPDMFMEIKNSWNDDSKTEEGIISKYRNAPLLMLDDLGVNKSSEWATSILYQIIDYRYRMEKPLLLTSNLSLDEIGKYTDDRIASRLCEMAGGQTFKLEGKDRRLP